MVSGHSIFFCAVLRSPKYSAVATRLIASVSPNLSRVVMTDLDMTAL